MTQHPWRTVGVHTISSQPQTREYTEPLFVNAYGAQQSIPPGWESIPGLLKSSTNTGLGSLVPSADAKHCRFKPWTAKKICEKKAQRQEMPFIVQFLISPYMLSNKKRSAVPIFGGLKISANTFLFPSELLFYSKFVRRICGLVLGGFAMKGPRKGLNFNSGSKIFSDKW